MSLQEVFYPKSIAIIGASTKIGSVGNDVVKNLTSQGFKGQIYPINPKTDLLFGLKCYKDISEIPGKVDLVIIAIPAANVPALIAPSAAKGAKAAVVISAGFKEVGSIDLEHKLKSECDKFGISLIGPNCLGVLNPEIKMNASFAAILPKTGPIGFFSQSGALCTAVLDYAEKLGIGFSKFVSMGNKAQTDEVTLFEFLHTDPQTKVIAMYMEDLKDGEKFRKAALKLTKAAKPKPIIVLKSGRTSAGANASASHTGSLAGSDSAYDALFRQSCITRANSVSELFDLMQVFSNNPLPKGKNVAIITNAGGPGVLTTDAAVSAGLQIAKLDPKTISELKAFLPPAASSANPIDLLGDAKADKYSFALQKVAADPNVDSVLLILTPQSMTEIDATAKAVIATKLTSNKPIVACFMGETTVSSGIKLMQESNISCTNFPEEAAKALGALSEFAEFHGRSEEEEFNFKNLQYEQVKAIFSEAKSKGITAFPEAEAIKILEAYGFPILKSYLARNKIEAAEMAQKIGKKLVMKIVSKDILHKFDAGGVILNVMPKDAAETFEIVIANCQKNKPTAKLEGVLLVEMVDLNRGLEFIVGSNKDATLGQMIMVGLGGIYVETFKDITFSMGPISKTEAVKMISRIKSNHLLAGARGQGQMDQNALIEVLGRLSKLLSDFPEIKELDINPLLILPQSEGVKCLDARILIE